MEQIKIALVTGATGFIGSHVVDKLIERGIKVKCLVRKSSDLTWLNNKPVELIEGSYKDMDFLTNAVSNVDYIFHVAGVVAAKNYEHYLEGNKLPTINLLEAVLKSNTNISRFIYISSQTAGGPAKELNKPSRESDELHPITQYGRSKKDTELAVRTYFDKIPITIIRPPASYGPRDKAIFSVFQTANAGIGALIGFDDKYVSLVHSEDLSRGIIEAALSEKTISKTYYIASDKFYTWKEVMPIMKRALGKRFFITLRLPHSIVNALGVIVEFFGTMLGQVPVFNKEKALDFVQPFWICSIDEAKKDFGYQQMISLEDGILDTVKWYKENKWL